MRSLSFLSDRMAKSNLVTFELVNLQFDWIEINMTQKFIADLISSIVHGIKTGLMFGVLFTMLVVLMKTFLTGLLTAKLILSIAGTTKIFLVGLFFGITTGVATENKRHIYTKDVVKWSEIKFRKEYKSVLLEGIMGGIIFGVLFGILFQSLRAK